MHTPGRRYVKLVDFGFAKQLPSRSARTYTLCGTPEYLAPEIVTSQGHCLPLDWWALGVFTFELLACRVPFEAEDVMRTYRAILGGRLSFPKKIRQAPRDLISRLLVANPSKRLGAGRRGAEEVTTHAFFRGISLAALEARELKPPYIPTLAHPEDTSNFGAQQDASAADAKAEFADASWDWARDRAGKSKEDYDALHQAFGSGATATDGTA
jgi:serine/threonine protein kinase